MMLQQVYKKPLEDINQVGGPLLDPTEVKIIFGNLPPIYEIHSALLLQLKKVAINWKEDTSVGALILKYVRLFHITPFPHPSHWHSCPDHAHCAR